MIFWGSYFISENKRISFDKGERFALKCHNVKYIWQSRPARCVLWREPFWTEGGGHDAVKENEDFEQRIECNKVVLKLESWSVCSVNWFIFHFLLHKTCLLSFWFQCLLREQLVSIRNSYVVWIIYKRIADVLIVFKSWTFNWGNENSTAAGTDAGHRVDPNMSSLFINQWSHWESKMCTTDQHRNKAVTFQGQLFKALRSSIKLSQNLSTP